MDDRATHPSEAPSDQTQVEAQGAKVSTASKITNYLSGLKPGEDYVPLDLDQAAKDLGIPRARLGSHVSAMGSKGRLEFVKDDKSRIIGFKNLITTDRRKQRATRKSNGSAPVEEPRPTRRLVQTPELDRVYEARSAMFAFVEQFAGMVDQERAEAALRLDPDKVDAYVREGMSLIDRNRWLENRNRELRDELASATRELGFLKAKKDESLRTALVSAGVAHAEE